jgi:hypothetical protein
MECQKKGKPYTWQGFVNLGKVFFGYRNLYDKNYWNKSDYYFTQRFKKFSLTIEV